MRNIASRTATLAIGAVLLVAMTGCVQGSKIAHIENQTLAPTTAKTVHAKIDMGVGVLTVHSGEQEDLLKASFKYNVDSWKPQVRYNASGDDGDLTVRQPKESDPFVSNATNEWDLAFNRNVALDLNVSTGAGGATLNVGKLNIQSLQVNTGVGESVVDLTGDTPSHDVDVDITGGAADTTLRLPAGVGVQVKVENGTGSVSASNLRQNGNVYTNDEYGKTAASIHATIKMGVGDIHIEQAH
jgi:hypothetical protein